jgi:hypothetical protein
MIISHEHRFIFVKTRKTAGTSLQEALAAACAPGDIVTPTGIDSESYKPRNFSGGFNVFSYLFARPRVHSLKKIRELHRTHQRIFDHMSLEELFALPEARPWKSYYRFCIERNPYDKMVSRYFWKYRSKPERPGFEQFLEHTKDVSDFRLYSLDGAVAVDRVGRYETLAEDVAGICRTIGIAGVEIGNRNSGTREQSDLTSLYTPRAREIVSRMFARELELFGYAFPG